MQSFNTKLHKNRLGTRVLCLLFAFLFLLSSLVAGTIAFRLPTQHRSNSFRGPGEEISAVILEKFERSPDGTATSIRIPDARFLLFKVAQPSNVQIGGEFVTDSNGRIVVDGLAPGEYFFYEIMPAPGFTFDLDEHGNPIRRFYFTILPSDTSGVVRISAFNRRLSGSLIVTKTVVNYDGTPLSEEQLAQQFEFVVAFSDNGTHYFRLNGTGEPVAHTSGDSLFLRHGESAVFENIPAGVVYHVTEVLPTVPQQAMAMEFLFNDEYDANDEDAGDDGVIADESDETDESDEIIDENDEAINENDEIADEGDEINGENDNYTSDDPEIIVEEDELPATSQSMAWNVRSNNHQGTIVADVPQIVEFVNTWRDEIPSDDVEITIYKLVDGEMPHPDQGFRFRLDVAGREAVYFYLYAGESASFTIPYGVIYTIAEVDIPDGFSLIQVNYGHGTSRYGIVAQFTNRFDGTWYAEVAGRKTWVHPEGIALPPSITVRLMNGSIIVREVVVTPDENGEWNFVFENLPRYDTDGNPIEYTIVELPVQNWTPEYNGFDIINHFTGDRYTSVSVRKVWNDGNNPDRPASVLVQLLRDGVAYGEPIALNAANQWMHTWRELDLGAVWTVYELDIAEGYTKTITGSAENGFVITNTYEQRIPPSETVVVEGQKTWNHGRNPAAYRPEQIIILVYANGERHMSFVVSEAQNWRWRIVLPRFDNYGNEFVWTIDEEYIADYRKSIDGFNITNSHVSVFDPHWPNPPPDHRPPSYTPQTGEDGNLIMWVAFMLISGSGLVITVISGKKLSRNRTLS